MKRFTIHIRVRKSIKKISKSRRIKAIENKFLFPYKGGMNKEEEKVLLIKIAHFAENKIFWFHFYHCAVPCISRRKSKLLFMYENILQYIKSV